MNDNRWLYFIVGGLLVVALLFFGVFSGEDVGDGDAARVESSAPASPGGAPAGGGTAAGESAGGGGSSTSVPVEQKKE